MNRSALLRISAPLLASVALLAHAARYDFVSDDAFIFARYARNLVEGHGLVFNVGERVEGFTSMLWVLLLAAAGAAGIDYVIAMRVASLLCAVGCIWVVHQLASTQCRQVPLAAVTAPLLTAASAAFACWSAAGLETHAFALAILLSLAAFRLAPERRDLWREAAALSACVLLRPEGVFVVATLSALRLFRGGFKATLRAAPVWACPMLTLAVLSVFRFVYYGDLIPNTARAKGAAGGQQDFGIWYAGSFFSDHGTWLLWLSLFGLGLAARTAPVVQAAALVGLVLTAVTIWVGGDGLPMYRFFVPILPLFALLGAHAVERLLGLGTTSRTSWARRGTCLTGVLLSGCALLLPDRAAPQFMLYDVQQREEIPRWTEVGRWLARHTPADASVACVPIGAVGYYSRRVVRDMVGLTDRHIASLAEDPREMMIGHRKHDGPYILSLKPSILLVGNVRVLQRPLSLTDPAFGRSRAPAVNAREQDLFGPELTRNYEPRIARLPSGKYLHYFQRRRSSVSIEASRPQ